MWKLHAASWQMKYQRVGSPWTPSGDFYYDAVIRSDFECFRNPFLIGLAVVTYVFPFHVLMFLLLCFCCCVFPELVLSVILMIMAFSLEHYPKFPSDTKQYGSDGNSHRPN
jgi:hypothetical protein